MKMDTSFSYLVEPLIGDLNGPHVARQRTLHQGHVDHSDPVANHAVDGITDPAAPDGLFEHATYNIGGDANVLGNFAEHEAAGQHAFRHTEIQLCGRVGANIIGGGREGTLGYAREGGGQSAGGVKRPLEF